MAVPLDINRIVFVLFSVEYRIGKSSHSVAFVVLFFGIAFVALNVNKDIEEVLFSDRDIVHIGIQLGKGDN